MDEQTFWALVDRYGPDPDDADRLADERSDHGAADIQDFADHLTTLFTEARLKRAGYAHAVIDREPFRSGRLNEAPARPAASR